MCCCVLRIQRPENDTASSKAAGEAHKVRDKVDSPESRELDGGRADGHRDLDGEDLLDCNRPWFSSRTSKGLRRQGNFFLAAASSPRNSKCEGTRELATVASGHEIGSDAKLLPECELAPVPGLGCSYHYQRLLPRRTDSAGSTVLVWVPTSYSDRVLQSHTHRHTCLIGYFARPGPTANLSRIITAHLRVTNNTISLEHVLGQKCPVLTIEEADLKHEHLLLQCNRARDLYHVL